MKIIKKYLLLGAAMCMLVAGMTAQAAGRFADVQADVWYKPYVDYVAEHGIMTGKSETRFAPLELMSRAEMVTVLCRMAGEAGSAYRPVFKDVGNGLWYTPYVIWAYDRGITTGYANGCFGPGDRVSREQFVTMLYRYNKQFGSLKKEAANASAIRVYADASAVSPFSVSAMNWGVELGIISGKSNGTRLEPAGKTSRAEAATMISRYMQANSGNSAGGLSQQGWIHEGLQSRFVNPQTGAVYSNGVYTIDGKKYLFDGNGYLRKSAGPVVQNGMVYRVQNDYTLVQGWIEVSGMQYYYAPGSCAAPVNCRQAIDGRTFTFNKDGAAVNYVKVGPGRTLSTIQAGVNALISRNASLSTSSVNAIGAYLEIDEGTYNESIHLNDNVSGIEFTGIGSVVWTSSAKYPNGPLYANGTNTYRNIVFRATSKSPEAAYGYHFEFGGAKLPAHSTEVVFENCSFYSEDVSAIGIGAANAYTHIRFKSCYFSKTVFLHNSVVGGGNNNYIVFQGCTGRVPVVVHDSSSLRDYNITSQLDLIFWKNEFSGLSVRRGSVSGPVTETSLPSGCGITINPASNGNTASIFNRS